MEFIHNSEILNNLKPTDWLIAGILESHSFYQDFGDPGHYKTFVTLDRLLCIASGIDYHGHNVKQGAAFYVAGEGQQGIGRRILAWHAAHGTIEMAKDIPLFISKVPAQLYDTKATDELAKAVDAMRKEYGDPAIIHFDTFARNTGGANQNDAGDVATIISNLDHHIGNDIARGFSHHSGHKYKERAMGSMALRGALDAEYRIKKHPDDIITVENTKMKDAIPPEKMTFKKELVNLRIGDKDERSVVLRLVDKGETGGLDDISTPKDKHALEILINLYKIHKENLENGGFDSAKARVEINEWKEACLEKSLYTKKTIRQNFSRTKKALLGQKAIREDGVFVFLTSTD